MRAALAVLLFAACASTPAPRAAAPSPAVTATPAPAAPVADPLAIVPLEVYFDGELVMTLRADGVVSLRRFGGAVPQELSAIFTLSADGTMVAVGGSGRGGLGADGRVRTPGGTISRFQLTGDTMTLAGRHLELDAEGVLRLDGPAMDGTPPHVKGVVDRASRRTAMVLLGIFLDAWLTGQSTAGGPASS